MACEPTILLYYVKPFSSADSVRYKLFPSAASSPYNQTMRLRGAILPKSFLGMNETAKNLMSTEMLCKLWENHQHASLYFYENEGFRQGWLEKVEEAWTCTEPLGTIESSTDARRILKKGAEEKDQGIETNIAHVSGEEEVTHRKLTQRQRAKVNPALEDDNPILHSTTAKDEETGETDETELQIAVSQTSLRVVQALYSNAQANAQSVRWVSFCNFMIDAGCTITLPNGGGASTKFAWTHVNSGAERGLTLHRPHPVPILEPQMLRNVCTAIRGAFGWEYQCFVLRNAA